MIEILELQSACSTPALSTVIKIAKDILFIFQIFVPLILMISMAISFTKLIANPNNKKLLKKIFNSLLAAVIVFFIPLLINVLMGILGQRFNVSACWNQVSNTNITASYIPSNKEETKNFIQNSGIYEKGEPRSSEAGNQMAELASYVSPTALPMSDRIVDKDGSPWTWDNDSRLKKYRKLAEAVRSATANKPHSNWAWASCHQAVGVIVRAVVDPDFNMSNPRGGISYLKANPSKWKYIGQAKNIKDSKLQPGDILIASNKDRNHTALYLGKEIAKKYHPGTTGLIWEASFGNGTAIYPGITSRSVDNFQIYRFIGTPKNSVNVSNYMK